MDVFHSTASICISPLDCKIIDTCFQIASPPDSYIKVEPLSNTNSTLHTLPGVIDSPSHGTVTVMLQNHGKESITITTGQYIAQLMCVPSVTLSVEHCALVPLVSHDCEEYCTTTSDLSPSQQTTHLSSCSTNIITFSDDEIELSNSPVKVKGFVRNMDTDIQPPYNIYLTSDLLQLLVNMILLVSFSTKI